MKFANMNRYFRIISCFGLFLGMVVARAGAQDIYRAGFEADEATPFTVGPLPQNGWTQVIGPGNSGIVDTVHFEGAQSLAVAANSQVDRAASSTASVVYVDGWFDPPVSEGFLDLNSLPEGSAVFLFDTASGLMALDGDGTGGGAWVSLPYSDFSTFARFTTRLDFINHTWDLYVNENREASGLGFKDNSINQLSGLRIQSSSDEKGFLDNFTVTTIAPGFILVDTTSTPTRTITPTSTLSRTATTAPSSTATPTLSTDVSPTLSRSQTPAPSFTGTSTPTPSGAASPISSPTRTPTSSFTGDSTPTSTPTLSLTPSRTPLQPGTPVWWFSFALHWTEEGITEENEEFNDTRPGEEDETLNAKDILYFLNY